MKLPPKPRVAVLIGSSMGWREKVMRGIGAYAHEHGPWHVYSGPEGVEDSVFFGAGYRWDGVLTRVTSETHARRILRLGAPAVSMGSIRFSVPQVPRVKVDDAKLAKLAYDHLFAVGLRHFAYCGPLASQAEEDRGAAFAALARDCSLYLEATKLPPPARWQARQRDLARWLRRLSKPVGGRAWNWPRSGSSKPTGRPTKWPAPPASRRGHTCATSSARPRG